MKKNIKLSAALAAVTLLATAAHAETLQPSKYQETAASSASTMSTSASPMQDTISNETVKEPANIEGGASMDAPAAEVTESSEPKAGDNVAADTATMGSTVKVKLPSGKIISVNDSADSPWNRSEDLSGYDRFTFDPVNNVFVAGKGEKEFESNWDDNGNRIAKVVKVVKKAPKKVEVKSDEEATTETTTESTTTEETPAAEPTSEAEPVAPEGTSGH